MNKTTAITFSAIVALAMAASATTSVAQAPKRSNSSAKVASNSNVSMSPSGWRKVYSDAEVTVSVDPARSARQPDGMYRAQLWWAYPTSKHITGGGSYKFMEETLIMDCDSLRSKPVKASTFDASGKPVTSFSSSDAELVHMPWASRKGIRSSAKAFAAACNSLKKH